MGDLAGLLDDVVRRGGTATRTQLAAHARTTIERAIAGGALQRPARGVYSLPAAPAAVVAAAAVRGVVSHASAAQMWMVDPLHRPGLAHVTLPRTASRRRRAGTRLHWADLRSDEVLEGATSPLRTVLDCARTMPFGEALGVADGCLRRGLVRPEELRRAATALRGAGGARVRRVAAEADGRSDNPFESALRALVLEAGVGSFVPQVVVDAGDHGLVRPDLVDVGRRLVLEADSFAWHGSRAAFAADCVRYNALVLAGWLVLRFSWEQVVHHPEQVVSSVRRAVEEADRRLDQAR